MISLLSSNSEDFDAQLSSLITWESNSNEEINNNVRKIIKEVKDKGDSSVLKFTSEFDSLNAKSVSELIISKESLKKSFDNLNQKQKNALNIAAQRIESYHLKQKQESWNYTEDDGTVLGQKVSPLDRVGLYVPGGKAAYPSSVLMNSIPAKVAGVNELIMVVPTPRGVSNELVLAAAHIADVDMVITIGGAQAIAALAYGTETIPKVDKIVGPGNIYVATAKKQVFGQVGIDMIAGPSEILIICDGSTEPDWIAMDLFSQAEHDEEAQSILLCPDEGFIEKVRNSIQRLLPSMERENIIRTALKNRGALILTKDIDEAIKISNKISPTSSTARFSSPLGVYDFQKRSSIIMASKEGAINLGETAATLAYGEGLQAHAISALYRTGKK